MKNGVATQDNKNTERRWGLGPCRDPLHCALCSAFESRDGEEMRMIRDLYCRGIPPWILADLVTSQSADKVPNSVAMSVERHANSKNWNHRRYAHIQSLAQKREEMYWHILLGRFKQTRHIVTNMTPDRVLEMMGKLLNKQQIVVNTEIEANIPWEDQLFKLRATQTIQSGEASPSWKQREEEEDVVEIDGGTTKIGPADSH